MEGHPTDSGRNQAAPQGRERRRGPRRPASLPVLLTYHENGQKILEQTVTLMLSRFGCGVYSRRIIAPGTSVELEYSGARRTARVVYTLRHSNTKLLELGLAFEQDASGFWGLDFDAPPSE